MKNNNRRSFIKKIGLLGLLGGFWISLISKQNKKRVRIVYGIDNQIYVGPGYPRYIYVKSNYPFSEEMLKNSGYSFPHLVQAIDLKDMCGFTPQDWNSTWTPDKNYLEVSEEEFKKYAKQLKSVTTHFDYRYYCHDIDDFGIKNKLV